MNLFKEQTELISKFTIFWLKQGVTEQEWLNKKDYYLMNAVGITYSILSKSNIRGSNIEDLYRNCLPHASQFFTELQLVDGPNHLNLLVKEIAKYIDRESIQE